MSWCILLGCTSYLFLYLSRGATYVFTRVIHCVFGAIYGIGKFSIFNATVRYALIYAANFARIYVSRTQA